MSLREDLAKDLNEILNKYSIDGIDPEDGRGVARDLADECIRQMEWARRECIVDDSPEMDGGPGGAMIRPSEYHNAPCTLWDESNQRSGPTVTIDDPRHPNYGMDWKADLTLAPPDWKPE